MYLKHFGLDESPFSITPDPTFIYLSQRHRDALAHLLYGVGKGGSGGFVQLTGEVGTGKTTLCRALLEQVPAGTHIALVLNPLLNPVEMLATVCEELGVDTHGALDSPKALFDRLTRFLLDAHERGERVVLVIDEAQNLTPESLEQVRLLTNLETSKEKLLQIILLGQPELRELLQRRSLRQLAQRITARYHLTPLGIEDTRRYIDHRLQIAGASHNPFSAAAIKTLFQRSGGVPRLINIIADRAMTGAYAADSLKVTARGVHAAADEVQLGEPGVGTHPWPKIAGAAALVIVLVLATAWLMRDPPASPSQSAGGEQSLSNRTEPVGPATASAEPVDKPVQAAEPPPAIPPPEELARSLDSAWLADQQLRTWNGYGQLWGRSGDAALIESTCLGREGLGFACLQDQGNWTRIQQLGLPVILILTGGENRHLLLRGVDGGKVMVGAPGSAMEVSREAVETLWLGEYLVAWPQARNWPRAVAQGDSGEAVETILELASRAEPGWTGPAAFNEEFESWLIDFQQSHGLNADGIVGPKTLLYLMRFSIDEPRLRSSWQPGS